MNRLFESLSLVYGNLRCLMQELSKESGAKMVVTLSAEEDFDDGILILSGLERFVKMYDISDFTLHGGTGDYMKAEFQLFGVKFVGYIESEAEKERISTNAVHKQENADCRPAKDGKRLAGGF